MKNTSNGWMSKYKENILINMECGAVGSDGLECSLIEWLNNIFTINLYKLVVLCTWWIFIRFLILTNMKVFKKKQDL